MDLNLNETKPNSNELFQGFHSKYLINNNIIVTNIRSKKLSPLYPFNDEKKKNFVFCPICYGYYPKINVLTCCNTTICTECFSATVSLDPLKRRCPICRSNQIGLKGNLSYDDGCPNCEPNQEPSVLPDISDNDLLIWALQYPKFEESIKNLIKKQIPNNLIIQLCEDIFFNQKFEVEIVIELILNDLDVFQILYN